MIVAGDFKVPRTKETSFRKHRGKKEPYTIDAIWFYLTRGHLPYVEYIKEATEAKVEIVQVMDRTLAVELRKYGVEMKPASAWPEAPAAATGEADKRPLEGADLLDDEYA